MQKIFCLIKFMDPEYVASFIDDGLLYMNTAGYFRTYEEDNVALRADQHEGLSASYSPDEVELRIEGRVIDGIIGKIDSRPQGVDELKLYCMTVLTHSDIENGFRLDPRFLQFGSKAVVIEGAGLQKFIDKLQRSIETTYPRYESATPFSGHGIVQYVNRNDHHNVLTIFHKFLEYQWQHEYRVALEIPIDSGPFALKIGSLKNIAYVADTKELINTEFRIKSAL
jgi:hypothetical protein